MTTAADTEVCQDYLADCERAGLLDHHDGLPYVAGAFVDPAIGERQFFAEYCDPRLIAAKPDLDWLVSRTRAEEPDAELIVVRTAADAALPRPWNRHHTYVRHDGDLPAAAKKKVDVRIVPATAEHTDAVRGWLVQSFTEAAAERRRAADPKVLRDMADTVLAQEGRTTYVAVMDGRPIGHLTVRPGIEDEVTGRRFVELCDVLVEEASVRPAVIAALVPFALEFAVSRELPLLGQVHHPDEGLVPGKGDAILRGLLATGWVVDHAYWRRTP
jgi:hypothetical protein